MYSNRKVRKFFAVLLLIIFVQDILLPPFARALTGGPHQPEFTTFEPVDATDMVNLLSGDFTYTLPILNVPGPEGGYPLALSYHANVTLDQQASWVGLGWNINPGAISRRVIGYPDDANGNSVENITYFENDPVKYKNLSLDYGIPEAGASVGLGVTWNSYSGFGGDIHFGGGVGGQNSPFSAGGSIGTEGIGVFAGAGTGSGGLGMGGGAGVLLGWDGSVSGFAGGGIAAGNQYGASSIASVGVSFSSFGTSTISSIGGVTLMNPSLSSNDFGSRSVGWMAPVPLWMFGIPLSITYSWGTFYSWMFKTEENFIYGSLYSQNAINNDETWGQQHKKHAMDVYVNPYNEYSFFLAGKDALYPNPTESNNLMFPGYDQYIVAAQGIGGSFTPRMLQLTNLTREGIELDSFDECDDDDNCSYQRGLRFNNRYNITKGSDDIHFRFNYEPTSFAKISPGTFSYDPSTATVGPLWGHSYTGGSEAYTNPNSETNYNSTNKRLGGSRYIEWFTNKEIFNNYSGVIQKGLVEYEPFFSTRGQAPPPPSNYCNGCDPMLVDPDGIGAIMITAEDGKTYHYALPVYQFESIYVNEKKDAPSKEYNINLDDLTVHANTWLLTAITGPDYVDRPNESGVLGTISDNDWGYWVKFEYGKWSDAYIWRSPYQDGAYEKSTSNDYGFYSAGRKQIYYLNSIQTRTHTAYFIKSLREDGYGKSDFSRRIIIPENTRTDKDGNTYMFYSSANVEVDLEYSVSEATKLLKLDKIILIKNKVNNKLFPATSSSMAGISAPNPDDEFKKTFPVLLDASFSIRKKLNLHYPENILDENDIPSVYEQQNALQVIEFNYDYSLCGNTPNSEPNYSSQYPDKNKGKLTLKEVKIKGKGGADIMPSYKFGYGSDLGWYDQKWVDDWGNYIGHEIQDASIVGKKDFFKKEHVDVWSLQEIETPLGGKIKINYKPDSYYTEAVFDNGNESFDLTMQGSCNSSYSYNAGNNILKINLCQQLNTLNNWFDINKFYNIDFGFIYNGININSSSVFYPTISTDQLYYSYYLFFHKEMFNLKLLTLNDNAKELSFELNNHITEFFNDLRLVDYADPILLSIYSDKTIRFGGGLRVASIATTDENNNTYTTSYNYNNPATGQTSGITSFAPHNVKRFIPYIYEIPGPAVMYEYVTVENIGANGRSDSKRRYHFDVLKPSTNTNDFQFNMGDHFWVQDLQHDDGVSMLSSSYSTTNTAGDWNYRNYVKKRSSVVHDNLAALGRILSIENFDIKGNAISKVDFTYLNPADATSGIVQETFTEIKRKYQQKDGEHISAWYLTSASKMEYPNFPYKTVSYSDGVVQQTTNLKFDFNTGKVLETEYENSLGDKIITKIVPAYERYGTMGLKSDDENNNKNMLVQNAESYTYLGSINNSNLLSTSIQTWNNNWDYREYNSSNGNYATNNTTDIWRKHKTWVWKSSVNQDGTIQNFVDFNWATASQNAGWQKVNEVTLYDHYSHPLEALDINGDKSATKFDINNEMVVVSSGNASYGSFAASSFEETPVNGYFGGEVKQAGTWVGSLNAHTGLNTLRINSSTNQEIYSTTQFQPDRKYRASVWRQSGNGNLVVDIDGTQYDSEPTGVTVNDWSLITVDVVAPAGASKITAFLNAGSSGYTVYDDFRIHPIDAPVNSYVYDQHTGLVTAILDVENFATFYEYDDAGRLISVNKETEEGIKKVTDYQYHFGRQ